jgi:tight adherence protein C
MSSLYLPLGLIASFAAILLLGVAAQLSGVQRRRAVQVLEAQVGSTAQTDLWGQELSRPFWERIVRPFGLGLASLGRRITPIGARDRIERKLVLAGSPAGWDVERIAAIKTIGTIAGVVLGIWGGSVSNHHLFVLVFPAVFGFFGFFGPTAILDRKVEARQTEIRKALPDTMDMLTISVEAGLGFDAALAHVTKNVDGPLSMEIGRMLHEVQLGVSRMDAFKHLAARTDVEELNGFVMAMVQADLFGVSISKVLRAQAKEQRQKRRQRAERKAMQLPTKLMFPLIFCILPALLTVIAGPGIIRIAHSVFGINP